MTLKALTLWLLFWWAAVGMIAASWLDDRLPEGPMIWKRK